MNVEVGASPVGVVYEQVVRETNFNRKFLTPGGRVFIGLSFSLASAALIILSILYYGVFGSVSSVSFLFALLPFSLVLGVVLLFNRWDERPWFIILMATLWGAGAASLTALILNTTIQYVASFYTVAKDGNDFFSLTIVAPIVEESGKGLMILGIFLFLRRFFNNPVDGLIYGGVIAAGFALMENVLYFSDSATSQGIDVFYTTVLVRSLAAPFTHATFTILIGFGVGIGALFKGYKYGVFGFMVGLVSAVVLHSLWNGSSVWVIESSGVLGFIMFYLLIEFPIFLILTTMAIIFYNRRKKNTLHFLQEYSKHGWFTSLDVELLGTGFGRKVLRKWGTQHGASKLVKNYLQNISYLTSLRGRIMQGDDSLETLADEMEVLENIQLTQMFININTLEGTKNG